MAEISGRAPKKLYWLDVVTTGKLKYREKGGGKYTEKYHAREQQRRLSYRGIESVLFETKPLEWVEVKDDDE